MSQQGPRIEGGGSIFFGEASFARGVRRKVSTPRCLHESKRRYHKVHIRKQRMNGEQREKYSRQILFPGIGSGGQQNLVAASAVLVGCGALGTVVANLLVRAGLGWLRIVARAFVRSEEH